MSRLRGKTAEIGDGKAGAGVYIKGCVVSLQSPVVTICTARFNIQQFYVLPTEYIYVFCVDLIINSDYFPIQH